MTNWINRGPTPPSDDETPTELHPVPDKQTTNWLDHPGQSTSGEPSVGEDFDSLDHAAPTPAPRRWTTSPEDKEQEQTPAAAPASTAKGTKGDKPKKPPRPPKSAKQRSTGWIKPTAISLSVVLGGAALVGTVVVAARTLGTDGQDSAPVNAQTSVAATTDVEPMETTDPREQRREELSAAESVGVGGQCSPGSDEVEITPSARTLRAVVVAYQTEYWAHNAEGLKATLTEKSSMRDNDWDKVFASLDEDSSWCATMQPVTGRSVDVDLRVNTGGVDTVYRQKVTGEEDDQGHWRIRDITQRGDES